MKARTDTKEKIVQLGTELVLTAGYPSLSYQQISSQLGIKNAAIHYHYPGKEDLGMDIVQRDFEKFESFTISVADLGYWEKLESFMGNYRKYLENDNKICLIGACASDYREMPKTMQEASAVYLTFVKKWFVTLLETGREEGFFYFKGESVNKASLTISAMAGALQHARLIGNDHYDAVITQIKLELKE